MERQRLVEYNRPQNFRMVVLGFGSKKQEKNYSSISVYREVRYCRILCT